MSNAQVSLAKSLAKGTKEPKDILHNPKLNTQNKQYILESAIELSEYRFLKGKLEKEHNQGLELLLYFSLTNKGCTPRLISESLITTSLTTTKATLKVRKLNLCAFWDTMTQARHTCTHSHCTNSISSPLLQSHR